MLVENNKKEISFLKSLGFEKEEFDDKSAYWFVKKLQSKLFGHCQINVEDFKNNAIIVVDMYDAEDKSHGLFTAIIKKYSRNQLIKILGILL